MKRPGGSSNRHRGQWFRSRIARRRSSYDGQSAAQFECLEPRCVLASGVVISEFMASNDTTLQDARGSTPDWIELHNVSSEAVNLQGWSLTDDRDRLNRWRFPELQLEAGGYLIVFASGEDRRDTELHTNFKLDADGEDLILVGPDGTVASQYRYPAQSTDVSYGLSTDATTVGYLSVATPGQPNSLIRGRDVQFDHASGLFVEPFFVTLSLDGPTVGTIHYTIDGTEPTVDSPIYTDPIRIEATTWVQAISVDPGAAPSGVTSRWHMKVGEGLHDFTSDLPVVVVDNFGQGALNQTTYQYSGMAIFEPDPITGRTSLLTTPQLETRAGLKVRGQDSSGKPKQHYAVEAWDERNRDTEISPFGFPAESDWIMFPPYDTDRALLRNSIMFERTSQMGRYAPRQQFVEVYHNRDGGDLSAEDYVGVYVFLEKIKRGDDRIDVKGLGPQDNAEPEISGGWMLKLDVPDPGDTGFLGGSIQIQYVDPKEEDVTPEQAAWIKNYFDEMRQALTDTNPETGYAQYIDVDSWIDYHLLTVLAKNSDGLNRSTYFYKDRGGKIQFGPTWDNGDQWDIRTTLTKEGPRGGLAIAVRSISISRGGASCLKIPISCRNGSIVGPTCGKMYCQTTTSMPSSTPSPATLLSRKCATSSGGRTSPLTGVRTRRLKCRTGKAKSCTCATGCWNVSNGSTPSL